jgi:hypothetical protein
MKIMVMAAVFSFFLGFFAGDGSAGKPMFAIEARMARSLQRYQHL